MPLSGLSARSFRPMRDRREKPRRCVKAMKHSADLLGVARPVVALNDEYPPGFVDPMHSHDRTQILYASSGVMSVRTDKSTSVVPPQRAVWIPAGMMHEVSCRGAVSLRTLYIDAALGRDPQRCGHGSGHLAAAGATGPRAVAAVCRPTDHPGGIRGRLRQPECLHCDVPSRIRGAAQPVRGALQRSNCRLTRGAPPPGSARPFVATRRTLALGPLFLTS